MGASRIFRLALFAAIPAIAAAAPPQGASPFRILWIQGHNELSIESGNPDGGGDFRRAILAAFPGVTIEPVWLASLAADPPRDAVLVMAGPRRDVSEADAAKLAGLLSGGARLLVCIDPQIEHDRVDLARLRAVLRDAGTDVGADRIVDSAAELPPEKETATRAQFAVKWERAVFTAKFDRTEHPLLALLPAGADIVLSDACRVAAMARASDPFDAREIASTSASAFAVSTGNARSSAGPVLVAAARRAGPGRYVVAGDATFLTNGFVGLTGRKDAPLAIAALRWLAEGIEGPRAAGARRAPSADIPDEDRQPLALYGAATVAALLVIANAVLRGKG